MHVLVRSLAAAGMTAAILVAVPADGDVIATTYTDQDHYQFQRIDIPDLDQERFGLVNQGGCHCVPTSTLNLLIYAANHGFPNIQPGPGSYGGQATYLEVTQAISDLGQEMAICYGGGEMGMCDPTVCDTNGDCVLACGSTDPEVVIIGLGDWLGDEAGKFNIDYYKAAGSLAPRLHHLAQISVKAGAPLMRVNYGRYKYVDDTPGGDPIYRRTGGHAMSFVGCFANGSTKKLHVRDPGQSEQPDADLFGQSSFTNRTFQVSDITARVTSEKEPPVEDWDTRLMSYLGTTDGGELMLLDVVAWIQLRQGYSFTSSNVIVIPSGDSGFGIAVPPPSLIPISGGSLVGIVPDAIGLGVLGLVLPEVGSPQVQYVSLATGESSLVATVGGATALASGRQHDLYVITAAAGGLGEVRRYFPAPMGDLADYEPATIMLSLPYGIDGAVFDNDTDELVLVSTGAFKLSRAPRDLDTTSQPLQTWDIPTATPIAGAASLAVEPGTDRTWVATGASNALHGLAPDGTGGLAIETIARPDIQNPTSLSFDDDGRLFVRADGGVIALKRDVAGTWQRDPDAETPYATAPLGEVLLLSRHGGNYDAAIHGDEEQWGDIPVDELPDVGELVSDCTGDLNFDNVVDTIDFLALLAAWGTPGADLDGDGTTDTVDFLLLLAGWGPCL